MQQYLDLVGDVLAYGEETHSRTGVNTLSMFGAMLSFDLREGFPLMTTKKVLWDTVVDELLWFIRGGSNINDPDAPRRIWDDWADDKGNLGRIYGVQWRGWRSYEEWIDGNYDMQPIDQLTLAIQRVKKVPNSRRNIISAWNVGEIESGECSFPPCHTLFQLRRYGNAIDLAMYQRSADLALGVPFNIASYALLLAMIAHETGLEARRFVHFLGDAHVYVNHIEGLTTQRGRSPLPKPRLVFTCPVGTPVVRMHKTSFHLQGYEHHPFIRFPVAV